MLMDFINKFIDSAPAGYISFGLLLALFFASNGMMGLMRSFDRGYIGFSKRNTFQKRWTAIKLTSLLYALFFICIILMISQSNVLTWIGVKNQFVKELIVYGRWIPIFALLFYSFAFIYKYAPNTQKRWRLLSPGALFATLCSIVFYWGFSSFVDSFNRYNILYGSLGTVIVIMILVFLNSLAILIGFELNVSINSLKSIADKRKEDDKSASLHKR
jgi:membrane protein